MVNKIEIVVTGKNLTKPEFDAAVRDARAAGQQVGDQFSKGVENKIEDAIPAAARDSWDRTGEDAKSAGEQAGFDFTDAFGGRVRQDLPPTVDKPLEDLPPKAREKGKQTGDQFSQGMSPLLVGAFTAAATIGPAAILAGVATATVGAAALIAKSNDQVAADYQNLGTVVSSTLTNAVSPVVGHIDAAVNILSEGITQLSPELDKLFAVAGPDAEQLAGGLVKLAQGVLPGITQGMSAIAPEMHAIAGDVGKIGQGLGGFIGGLGVGASGATTGFNALAKSLSEILPDLGQIIGDLSNGLGPALADVLPVVDGVAKGITVLMGVLNPGEIQAAGVALAGLFAAFKIGGLAGALQEGVTFTSFLKGSGVAAAESEGKIKSFAVKGIGGLSAALDVATGPLGLIIAGAGLLGNELGKLSGVGDHTTANVDALTSAMADAANGSAQTQGQIDELANAFTFMATGPLHATNGLKSMDDALVKLQQTSPAQAAQEFALLSKSMQANGVSAAQVAKDFPQYTQAVQDAQLQSHLLGTQTDQLSQSLATAAQSAHDAAQKTAEQALAALGATDGQNKLTLKLDDTITAYETATGEASAYKTALDAMYGKYQDYSQAQATFTTDVANATGQITKGKDAIDLTTKSGAANFTLLGQLATQNENVAEALLKQTGNQQAANKSLQDGAVKIDALAKSAGFTDGQIAQLNKDLYGTASIKDIKVTVSANTDAAYSGVNQLLNFVNSSGATIHVYENANGVYNTGMTGHAKASGGVVGAFSGLVRGGRTLVGEYGPEVVDLPMGSTVHSNPDTQRMLGAGSGGASGAGGAFELTVSPGSDGAVATMIMTLVRTGQLQIRQKAIVP